MLTSMKRSVLERVRCAKHNWLDGRTFAVRYRRGQYGVRTATGERFRFDYNPYTVFAEIDGYLAEGAWELEPGMWVLDAGACRGEFSLYASRRVGPEGRVFMMEPDPDNVRLARQTFAANGGWPDNVVLVEAGLWSEPTTLRFATGLGTDSFLLNAADTTAVAARSDLRVTAVPVQSVASLVDAHRMPRLDLVKMDIEGAEVEAVRGAGSVMSRLKPRFAIAAYHPRDGGQTWQLLEPAFRAAGYHVRTAFPRHLTTYASADPLPARLR